eukprot:GSA120T00019725001.1
MQYFFQQAKISCIEAFQPHLPCLFQTLLILQFLLFS